MKIPVNLVIEMTSEQVKELADEYGYDADNPAAIREEMRSYLLNAAQQAEHRIDMHQRAVALRKQGKAIWTHKIRLGDIFYNDEMSFTDIRDGVVRRLRASRWLRGLTDGDPILDLVDELADTTDNDEFNYVWDEIYNYADADRVWIETSPEKGLAVD